jgi:hypothetical protein
MIGASMQGFGGKIFDILDLPAKDIAVSTASYVRFVCVFAVAFLATS